VNLLMPNKDIEYMNMAIAESQLNSQNNYQDGGPFGAIITKEGRVVARAHNTVLKDCDATAHAEINAIREASKTLGNADLTGCVLYSSSEPCPMCMAAIIWANIKEVYYANTKIDAANIGFRDDLIYQFFREEPKNIVEKHHLTNTNALEAFQDFSANNSKKMY